MGVLLNILNRQKVKPCETPTPKERMNILTRILFWLIAEPNLDKAWENAKSGMSFYRRGFKWFLILNPEVLFPQVKGTGTSTPSYFSKIDMTKRKELE